MLSLRLTALVIALSAGFLATAMPASAALPWVACKPSGYQCTQFGVPLDRSGAVPGSVALSVTRKPATGGAARTAVVALAGGPGQAAVPFSDDFRRLFAGGLATRDLLVFDQRGTGGSGALRCRTLDSDEDSIDEVVEACSNELGPARAFYTTAESVADLEELRVAGGYERLVLYGVSYGTKVAQAYASAHPQAVESLILDSVVPPEGPDALRRSTLAAVPRVVGQDLCGDGACDGITPDAVSDLRRLAVLLDRRSISGSVYSGSGRRFTARVGVNGLVTVLTAGDLNPALRAELPGAVRSALKGDRQPLARLSARSAGLDNGASAGAGGLQVGDDGEGDGSLYLATTCEEITTFPWTRGAPAAQRTQEFTASITGAPAGTFGIFPAAVGFGGLGEVCLGWQVASAPPAPLAPLPDVPALVLNGEADLRTPLEDAQAVAARLPRSTVLSIPDTGHSVASAELGTCAKDAIAAFLTGGVVRPCTPVPNPFEPVARAPRSLASVTPARNLPRTAGRTLNSLPASINDARLQVIGDAIATGELPRTVGGLRGGSVRVRGETRLEFRQWEYVPGVRITGTYRANGTSTFTFSGASASRGTVRVSRSGRATGTLGGRRVNAKPRASAASVASVSELPTLGEALAIGQRRARG